LLNPKENFDFETKVWDKMPTERETYYLTYLTALIRLEQTKLGRDSQSEIKMKLNLFFRFLRQRFKVF
jgi:hypothetical protein